MEPQRDVDLEIEFASFRRDGDVEALARVFDATAPGLLSVARHVTHRAAEAEDLVQQTFVTAIERAATFDSSRNLLAWLTGILALHACKGARQSARVVDPDRLLVRDVEDPHTAVQSAEFATAVDAAVAGLPVRYSEVLRLHLREQLPPREIARSLGLDATTARVQLHRGLKMLREALPAGLGAHALIAIPDRRLSAVRTEVLVHGARSIPTTPVALATASSAAALGLGALAVAALALVVVVANWNGGSTDPRRESIQTALTGSPNLLPTYALADPSDGPLTVLAGGPARVFVVPAVALQVQAATARVQGRLVLPDGRPAVGVRVEIHASKANQDRVRDFPPPADWEDPASVFTDVEGRFAIEFAPPRAFQFSADARLDGYARLSWRWNEIFESEHVDVGDRAFQPACRLRVRVLDANGDAMPDEFQVSAHPPWGGFDSASTGAVEAIIVNATFDAERRWYVLDGLPPGEVEVAARSELTDWLTPRRVVADPDQSREVALIYDGEDTSRRVVVHWSVGLSASFDPALDKIHLQRPGADPRMPKELARTPDTAAFDDVGPGPFVLSIDDPRFLPFVESGVESGTSVRAKLVGSAGVAVQLRRDGERLDVPVDILRVRYPDSNSTPNEFDLLRPKVLPAVDGFITGIVPGHCLLIVRAAGFPEALVDLGEVLPGERRRVTVEVDAARTIRGRLLDARGGPPSTGVRVLLTRGDRSGHGMARGSTYFDGAGSHGAADFSLETDELGDFAFEGLQLGRYVVRVAWSEWLFVDRTIEIGAAPLDELEIVRPPAGWVETEVCIPAGSSHDGLQVWLIPIDGEVPDPRRAGLRSTPGYEVQPGEVRRLGPLPPGRYRSSVIVQFDSTGTGVEGVECEVLDGAVARVALDLGATMPGRILARVRLGETYASDATVRVERLQDERLSGLHSVTVPSDGGAVLVGVAPGALRLSVAGPQEAWSWTDPRIRDLQPGRELDVGELDVPWIERVLVVRDANGDPLPRREIEYGLDDLRPQRGTGWASLRTDADGRVTLGLPPGMARLRRAAGPTKMIEWNATLGTEVEVRLSPE